MASPQKILVGVRSVYADVTGGTFLEFRIERIVARGLNIHAHFSRSGSASIVTLEADGEDHWPSQQPGIHRAMRNVTCLAAFHGHAGVLEYEGPPLIDVTLEARLVGIECPHQHGATRAHSGGCRECAMR